MVRKYGISVPDDLAEEVEAPLEYGDSRSERIVDLIELGLAVDEALDEAGVARTALQPERVTVSVALREYLDIEDTSE